MGDSPVALPYWNVNVPEDQQTAECPDYLRVLSAKDRGIISTPDAGFRVMSWAEVQRLVVDNRLDLFQRAPSELRRYLAYTWKLKLDHGSVMSFVLGQRLQWALPVVPRGRPFEHADDVKILWNDWPYGIDGSIVHLVVWTKFDLEEDPLTGDLTAAARAEIAAFVRRTLLPRVSGDQYIWFKNWRSLKSVHAVEHFHIMLYDPAPEFVRELTNGDVPLSRQLAQ